MCCSEVISDDEAESEEDDMARESTSAVSEAGDTISLGASRVISSESTHKRPGSEMMSHISLKRPAVGSTTECAELTTEGILL